MVGGRWTVHSYVEENHLLRGRYAKISTDDRGLYVLPRAVRTEVKNVTRGQRWHLSIYNDKEVVLLITWIFIPPSTYFFFTEKMQTLNLQRMQIGTIRTLTNAEIV